MKMKQAYKRTIIAYAVFSAIYQIVFVLAVYYLHDASGETIMYYAFPDISQLEGMGISPVLSVLFYVMIIAAFIWPVVMLGIISRAIAPKRAGRTAVIAGHLFLLALFAAAIWIVADVFTYHGLRAFMIREIWVLIPWLLALLRYKM